MKNYLFLLLFSILSVTLFAQEIEFESDVLNNPMDNKRTLLASFDLREVPLFEPENLPKRILLENGYAKYEIKNPQNWTNIKRDKIPVAIDIIYTKYPRAKENWRTEYHGLLANRLKALFELDPSLNSINITWNIILQTECYSERQTKKLFHGIAIHYISKKEKDREELIIADTLDQLSQQIDALDSNEADNTPTKTSNSDPIINENDFDTEAILDKIKASLPEDIIKKLEYKTADETNEIINDFYKKNTIVNKKEDITPEFIRSRSQKVEQFIEKHSTQELPEITKMLDRQKDWENTLVVMDWTGSMYGFGGEVMKWHLLNFEKSGIQRFVLFNDGDKTQTVDKKLGKTGGIYSQEATNIDQLLLLFELVMNNGQGGDRPENDLEAIIEGLKLDDKIKQVVLIADNRSCVRDMALLDQIKVPVKIILCGYTDLMGANPHYIQLAATTNGSIHTAEQDISDLSIDLLLDGDDLQLTRGNKSVLAIRADCHLNNYYSAQYKRDWVKKNMDGKSPQMRKIYYSVKKAMEKPDSVYRLELTTRKLEAVPKEVEQFKNLSDANFSYNNLKKIDKEILHRTNLENLDLQKNSIQRIPKSLFDATTLLTLNISHNQLSKIPNGIDELNILQELNLSHNKIRKTSKDLALLKRIKVIDLSYNVIEKLPVEYAGWRRLEKLNLSNNKIKSFPVKLRNLKRLKYLDLSHNQLNTPPNAIVGMRRLNYLDLSYNRLSKIPSGIGNLKDVTKINLSHNQITSIHRRFGDAKNLIELDLSDNQLKKLPTTLYKLRNLKLLDLRGNSIPEKEQERIKKMIPWAKVIF
ncbi:MAG: leucine-rich repeat domain-containing protein [Saprospiraceae bacterium]